MGDADEVGTGPVWVVVGQQPGDDLLHLGGEEIIPGVPASSDPEPRLLDVRSREFRDFADFLGVPVDVDRDSDEAVLPNDVRGHG